MNALERLEQDWTRLRQALGELQNKWQPAALRPVRLEQNSRTLDAAQALEAVASLKDAQGWIVFPDRIHVLPAELPNSALPPLSAEAFDGSRSIRIEHVGQGNWLFNEVQVSESVAAVATHLAERVQHAADQRIPGALVYERLWQLPSGSEAGLEKTRPTLGVFTGFKEREA